MKSTYQARTGHGRTRFAHKNQNGAAIARRKRALNRLELQRKRGLKPTDVAEPTDEDHLEVPLTEDDTKRIDHEIAILKTRV